jgi:hypothetical protein
MLLPLTLPVAGAIASRAGGSSGAFVLAMAIVIVALLAAIGRLTQGSLIVRPQRRREPRGRSATAERGPGFGGTR